MENLWDNDIWANEQYYRDWEEANRYNNPDQPELDIMEVY